MSSDNAPRSEEPKVDIWRVPRVLNARVERARFDPPRLHVRQGEESRVHEATAIVVDLDDDFPIRSAVPALFVGDVALTETDKVGEHRYRFFALSGEELKEGAPIGLGWAGMPRPIEPSAFTYRPPESV